MSKGPGNPYHDKEGKFASGPNGASKNEMLGGSNPRRWGRMNSAEKAKLTASAQFTTKVKPGKTGKLPTIGGNSPRMQPPKPFSKSEPNIHAVAITTAKALDRDFHAAKKKSDQEAMKAALAKSSVPIVKYPSTKPKSKDHPKTYMKTKR